jgi:hypothetical protein
MKSKAILISVFTSLSDNQLKELIEKSITLINIDRILISDTTYINDIDTNNVNKFNSILTCNVPDLSLHELNFITATLKEA